jgi:hypothetical protein
VFLNFTKNIVHVFLRVNYGQNREILGKNKIFSKKVAEKFGGNKNNAYLCTRN